MFDSSSQLQTAALNLRARVRGTKSLMKHLVPLLLLLTTSCAWTSVDYGKARFIYVNELSFDDEWFELAQEAAQEWSDATGGHALIKMTRDAKATRHTIEGLPGTEVCAKGMETPGTYLSVPLFPPRNCFGVADFNENIDTWHIGLALDNIERAELSRAAKLNVLTHELGHVFKCDHVSDPTAIMHSGVNEEQTLNVSDLIEYWDHHQ